MVKIELLIEYAVMGVAAAVRMPEVTSGHAGNRLCVYQLNPETRVSFTSMVLILVKSSKKAWCVNAVHAAIGNRLEYQILTPYVPSPAYVVERAAVPEPLSSKIE